MTFTCVKYHKNAEYSKMDLMILAIRKMLNKHYLLIHLCKKLFSLSYHFLEK